MSRPITIAKSAKRTRINYVAEKRGVRYKLEQIGGDELTSSFSAGPFPWTLKPKLQIKQIFVILYKLVDSDFRVYNEWLIRKRSTLKKMSCYLTVGAQ